MENNKKYLPPNRRFQEPPQSRYKQQSKKIINVDTTDVNSFPTLCGKEDANTVAKNVIGWNNILNKQDSIIDDEDNNTELSVPIKKWITVADIDENKNTDIIDDNIYLFNNCEKRYERHMSKRFELFLYSEVIITYQNDECLLIEWFEDFIDNAILPIFNKIGYIFHKNAKKLKTHILHWLFMINELPSTAIGLNFPINPWIIPNRKLRRKEDYNRYCELFPDTFWEQLYYKWSLEDSWIFDRNKKKGQIVCTDFPFLLYSLIDLNNSDITIQIDAEIKEQEESDAYNMVFNPNAFISPEDYNESVKKVIASSEKDDNLRGDRRHDLW
jgi:hypothetical protein